MIRPQPKGKTRKTINAKKKRDASARIKSVRAACVERDQHCALGVWQEFIGECRGPSEWAHHYARRRSKTRGMSVVYRHDRRFSFMACKKHHAAYDAHRFGIVIGDDGMDGAWRIAL